MVVNLPSGAERQMERTNTFFQHYNDVIMGAMASQITSLTIVYSTAYSDADQRKHQSSALLALCGDFTGDRWIPAQMASNPENVSIWWRHHEGLLFSFYHISGSRWTLKRIYVIISHKDLCKTYHIPREKWFDNQNDSKNKVPNIMTHPNYIDCHAQWIMKIRDAFLSALLLTSDMIWMKYWMFCPIKIQA